MEMRKHINAENMLLESYNINVVRNHKKDVENVAKRCGLRITYSK